MTQTRLGIDIGSTNVKICHLDELGRALAADVLAHDGNVGAALNQLLDRHAIPGDVRAAVTGTEGRHRIDLPEIIAPEAIEAALGALGVRARAVVSMGGEDMVVYTLDDHGRIVGTFAGNKCASGTGEFFRQQLGRMDLKLDDLERVSASARVQRLSARCSVFMKSDCTHRLNKGEATVGDIALSLSKVMADKVGEFLVKARLDAGEVVLTGGVTRNRFLVDFLREAWPDIHFVVPDEAPWFEAFGAALLADKKGATLTDREALIRPGRPAFSRTFRPLASAESLVRYAPSMRGRFDPQAEYILGVDGGSTTTKVALINRETLEIVAAHYGRTHGDPVGAVKECLRSVLAQLGGQKPRVSLCATTGSSRELLGVFLETPGVYNEIIAHTVGTTFFEQDVDTIFEIGGQDAKYVLINNGVPIDYAMNEACSAGTGSFLEESARGDLSIDEASEIGPVALSGHAPLKFGEHCSAFINSDIRKAIQQGAPREDIVAGLVFSVVANYLNRVVGNRHVGRHVVLQGGVAKNPAVPLAFAQMTGKPITVPPDPELMGCFGVALLARNKARDGLLVEQPLDLALAIERQIVSRGTFTCKACDNLCEIRNLEVEGHRYPFGGRCSKYTNQRKKKKVDENAIVDLVERRRQMLFEEFAAPADRLVPRTDKVVGVPRAFSVHSLWPFYSWFFHELGVRTVLSETISPRGLQRLESNYCFPAEIAHGALQDVLDRGVDYVFLPLFRDMPSLEEAPVHACVCPLTQGLPFFSRQAFNLDDGRILRPLLAWKHGYGPSRRSFAETAQKLGFTAAEGEAAYDRAVGEQERFLKAWRQLGDEVLAEIAANPDRLYVALLGRPYNAFTRDANMGIPRKLLSQGVTVVPFDMIFDPAAEIFPNMYWYYGQQDMKAVKKVRQLDNLYLTWISNFSCAPDSFMLHYVRWMMGQKPFLVLEIDSHTADAGLDTRIEAFLDIVESYRRHVKPQPERRFKRRYEVALKKEFLDVVDNVTGERFDIRDPRVTLVWPSMGDLSTQIISTAATKSGIKSITLPVSDVTSTQRARNVASGKECIPSLLVLGQILQFFEEHEPNRPGELWLIFLPSTLGPCRTGQYWVFYEHLFEDLGWENVLLLVGEAENSYREMGPTFNRDAWWALSLGDWFTDLRIGLKLLAQDVPSALEVWERNWRNVLAAMRLGHKEIEAALARAGRELSAVPRRASLDELKKVLIVGEIFVRRDDFSVTEICEFLIARGIFPKVTDITEWLYYTDFSRKLLMDEELKREGMLAAAKSGLLKEEAWYTVEKFYKDMVQHKIARHLDPAGLVPHAPHDMGQIIKAASAHFIEQELESEATVSSGVAAVAMSQGWSGIGIIAPFACLPGRLIEGVFAPFAKKRGWPIIALENDGQPYPPNIVARMEVFAHNVLRFESTTKKSH